MNKECKHEDCTILMIAEVQLPGDMKRTPTYTIQRCDDCGTIFKRLCRDSTGPLNRSVIVYPGETVNGIEFTEKDAAKFA